MGQKLNIAIEEKIIIQLPDLSTAGYSWDISGNFEDIISVEKMTKEKSSQKKTVGGQKEISFEITGIKKGKARLLFQQKRSWEDITKADREFEITVA